MPLSRMESNHISYFKMGLKTHCNRDEMIYTTNHQVARTQVQLRRFER